MLAGPRKYNLYNPYIELYLIKLFFTGFSQLDGFNFKVDNFLTRKLVNKRQSLFYLKENTEWFCSAWY